jgi:hypothetical protein
LLTATFELPRRLAAQLKKLPVVGISLSVRPDDDLSAEDSSHSAAEFHPILSGWGGSQPNSAEM